MFDRRVEPGTESRNMKHQIPRGISRRTAIRFGVGACCLPSLAFGDPSSSKDEFKISVDTAGDHVRNESLRTFASRLAAASGDMLGATVFSSAQLAKDRDVVKALHWGLVDIGVPAISKMTRFDPNANLFTLPMFYGSDLSTIHALNDGPVGAMLYQEMERKTQTHMLGRPIDLGYTNLYTTNRQVKSVSDMSGLKIRVPGSRASLELYKVFGGNPIVIPFSDLAIAVSQGNVDAVQTTHETLRSGQLWESGIRFCYEERSSYLGYVPLFSRHAWYRLPERRQEYLSETWESIVDESRVLARKKQSSARAELVRNGVEMFSDVPPLTRSLRDALFDRSIELARDLGMNLRLVSAAADLIGQASHRSIA